MYGCAVSSSSRLRHSQAAVMLQGVEPEDDSETESEEEEEEENGSSHSSLTNPLEEEEEEEVEGEGETDGKFAKVSNALCILTKFALLAIVCMLGKCQKATICMYQFPTQLPLIALVCVFKGLKYFDTHSLHTAGHSHRPVRDPACCPQEETERSQAEEGGLKHHEEGGKQPAGATGSGEGSGEGSQCSPGAEGGGQEAEGSGGHQHPSPHQRHHLVNPVPLFPASGFP